MSDDKKDDKKVSGTANVLKQTKSYEGLVNEYGKSAANGLMKKAINDAVPTVQMVTSKDVSGFAKVTEALRSHPVDVAETARQGMADAGQVVGDALRDLGKQPATADTEPKTEEEEEEEPQQ